MHVVATAGHVDHGKSTLVRALTGMEPDRWAEERRRGLTIDLGFAWTALPSGRQVAFVDVPGHERFLGNMLAGLGPVPVVCFVVAADEGWRAQSDDHRDAVAALGIEHGLIVLTRADRADPARIARTLDEARAGLAGTGLAEARAVVVSALTGQGIPELREALDSLLATVPAPVATGRIRLWVDRSFTITGAGAVVTGTLAAGTLRSGDRLELRGRGRPAAVTVRALQSRERSHAELTPVDRAAVNLRGIGADQVRRGDTLLTPGAWPVTRVVDVRRVSGAGFTETHERLTVHVGTAAIPARVRPFDDDHARITLERAVPLVLGDRLVLRDPGAHRIVGGAQVLDADPPALRRRGAGVAWTAALTAMGSDGDLRVEVARRGAVRPARLRELGVLQEPIAAPDGVREVGGWWVDEGRLRDWQRQLRGLVEAVHDADPLAAGLSQGAAVHALDLPDPALLQPISRLAGLETADGQLRLPGMRDRLGEAESGIAEVCARLTEHPFRAPEADELAALRLGPRELAAAERAGKLLRLSGGVVLLPTAPALAMRELAKLDQPFTTSAARQALDTSRRVVIPLLEHLDGRGWTRRLDAGHREVVR